MGRRLRDNRDGYLKAFDIDRYTRMVEARTYRDWWFIGEQPGKWLESAALTSRVSGDKALEEQARRILARLVAARPGSDVVLVVKMAGGDVRADAAEALLARLRASAEHPGLGRLVILDQPLTDSETKNLVLCCDAFVSLHRSEGFVAQVEELAQYKLSL